MVRINNTFAPIMKKICIFLLTCTFFIVDKAYPQDTINWSPSYKLKWEDFQGVPDSTTQYGAVSTAAIRFKYSNTEESFDYNVYCYFEKKSLG